MARTFVLSALVAVAVWGVAVVADDPTESLPGVIDLTPDNFDEFIKGDKHALVEFYAPWCGHCKRMVNDYKALGAEAMSNPLLKGRVVIAKVNADNHKKLATRFGVGGYPTIKYFARGKPVAEPEDYKGGRTKDAFVDFLQDKLTSDNTYGRVEVLDPIAAKFAKAPAGDKAGLLEEAKGVAAGVDEKDKASADLYTKYMQKAIEKGDEYLEKESTRLERLVDSGSVSAAKLSDIFKKISVLSAFLEDEEEYEDVE